MFTKFTFILEVFILVSFFLTYPNFTAYTNMYPAADTAQIDTTKILPNYYKNVDVKIIYAWNEDEPELFSNICCQLIKEKDVVVEIKLFRKDCTDKIKVLPGSMKYEIRDHESKKLIVKGM